MQTGKNNQQHPVFKNGGLYDIVPAVCRDVISFRADADGGLVCVCGIDRSVYEKLNLLGI